MWVRVSARLFAGLSALFGSFTAIAVAADQATEPNPSASAEIAIVGATLINPGKSQVLENAVVLIDGNKIVGVAQAEANKLPSSTRVIDAHGKWLLPGYVSMRTSIFFSQADSIPAQMVWICAAFDPIRMKLRLLKAIWPTLFDATSAMG
jgi:imidazolonepropionase-like amidohydrolase